MSSRKPCKKLCGLTKICNPNSGRCVDRNGAVGRSVLSAPKKRPKNKSLKSAKIKTSKSRKKSKESKKRISASSHGRKNEVPPRKSSPFHALGPDVLRYAIKPHLGNTTCQELTKKFGCKGTMSVFTDDEGHRMDCAVYCLSKCSPENLLPLFNGPSHAIFEKNGEPISAIIFGWEIVFSTYRYGSRVMRPHRIVFRNNFSNIRVDDGITQPEIVSKPQAAKMLCEFLKNVLKNDVLLFTAVSFPQLPKLQGKEKFIKFDHSWLRPSSEWNFSRIGPFPSLITKMNVESEVTGKGLKI
jgi:hypothetical protein